MFKKAFKVATHNVLSGKDKKKLRQDLAALFDPTSVDILLGKPEAEIFCDKLSGSKTLIFTLNDIPIFVDATGKGTYFPTVYAIQMCPNITGKLELNEGVDQFLFNGANLMWPGVKNSGELPPFEADDVKYVVAGDGKIIAVGAMACSKKDLDSKGPVGTAAFVLHLMNDKLWESGPQKQLDPIAAAKPEEQKVETEVKKEEPTKKEEAEKKEAKPEKTEKVSKEDEKKKKKKKKEEEEDDDLDLAAFAGGMVKKSGGGGGKKKPESKPVAVIGKGGKFSDDEDDKKKKKGKKGGKPKKDEDEDEDEESDEEEDNKKKKDTKKGAKKDDKKDAKKKGKKGDEDEEEKKSDAGAIPPQIMDEYLMEAFLTALKISVNDKDLPIEAGEFLNEHVLPCKKEGVFIDIKGTTYKKLGKFLAAMDKLGIIEYKEAGKKNQTPQVTKINRGHDKYVDFNPVVTKKKEKEEEEKEVHDDDKWPKVAIEEVYKPKQQLLLLLKEEIPEGDQEKLFTQTEIYHAVTKYLTKHKLLEKKEVQMNEELTPLFWRESDADNTNLHETAEEGEGVKKKTKKGATVHTLPKDVFFKRVDDYCTVSHKITTLATGKSETKVGQFKGINIIAEKAHNKNVTRVTGLEPFLFNIPKLVSKWQSQFACSVSTHVTKEKNTEKTEITVQGSFFQEIQDYLEQECKIDPKYIILNNKLEKKKKKE